MLIKNFFLITIIFFTFINQNCESIWMNPITVLYQKLNTKIDSAIDEINNNLNETNKKINNISEQLINSSEEFSQLIYNRVIERLKKMNDKLNNLTVSNDMTSTNKSHVDFTECKKISESMDLLALTAYSNMSYCVIEKIEFCDGYGESIKVIANDLLANISILQNNINNCTANLNFGINSVSSTALDCLKGIGVAVTWITNNGVPDIILKITNLLSKMLYLQIELPYCVVTNGIDDLSDKYDVIYDETKKCVDKKKESIAKINN